MKIPISHHNTTRESDQQLAEYEGRAIKQEDRILEYYASNWHTSISPSRVHRYLMPDVPLTSVRRAITNLTNQGKLERTDKKVDGVYGRPEYCWRYAGPTQRELPI